MPSPRFLQIHTLHTYTGALLNRDDTGLAKQLPYGGTFRTRISSQCLKRHWRIADDVHALSRIDGGEEAFRSRELVTERVIRPLDDRFPKEVLDALEPEFQKAVYGEKADKGKRSRQTLLLGAPELAWLADEAERLAAGAAGDAKAAKAAVADWAKGFKDNIRALREATALPGGLTAALFGRMVTSDPAANIDAPVHVAHAFTVHAQETETDYFTAVDDLKRDEDDGGADTIQETELTSGLYYGYVVIDLPGLIANCGGNAELAGRVVHNLIHLIAEVSPGAKLGSTAPYGRAELMLLEAGDRQPRSLAAAFRKAIPNDLDTAAGVLGDHLGKLDAVYATGEARRHLSLAEAAPPASTPGSLADLAVWAQGRTVQAGTAQAGITEAAR
ncbi:type I-E CRISPR-associated protein Cas7/Cse4/CasC [Azospirillum argentinense]